MWKVAAMLREKMVGEVSVSMMEKLCIGLSKCFES